MKAILYTFLFILLITTTSSCMVWNKVFPPKYGCGTNGKNVGAEKILDGSYNKKPKKFKD